MIVRVRGDDDGGGSGGAVRGLCETLAGRSGACRRAPRAAKGPVEVAGQGRTASRDKAAAHADKMQLEKQHTHPTHNALLLRTTPLLLPHPARLAAARVRRKVVHRHVDAAPVLQRQQALEHRRAIKRVGRVKVVVLMFFLVFLF